MKNYFQAPWRIKEVLVILFSSVLLVASALAITGFLDLRAVIEGSSYKSYYVLIGLLVQWILILAPLIFITTRNHGFKFSYFGFAKISFFKGLWKVIEAYLLFIIISIIISILILYTNLKIPGYQVQEDILPLFGDGNINLIIAGIVIVIIAPIAEEFFFRGFLLRSLSNKIGIYYGSIITAFLFAIFHFQWQSIIPIFILGLIINSLVIRTKSIYPAIAFHMLNNGISLLVQVLIANEVISVEKVL